MAKLNSCTGSDDELPDIADLLREAKGSFGSSLQKQDDKSNSSASPGKTAANRRQRPLKIAHINSLLLPLTGPIPQRLEEIKGRTSMEEKITKGSIRVLSHDKQRDGKDNESVKLRSSPRKAVRERVDYSTYALVQEDDLRLHSDSSSQDHFSDFTVDDSDSDLGTPPLRSPSKHTKRIQKGDSSGHVAFRPLEPSPIIDLTSQEKPSSVDSRPHPLPCDPFNDRSDEDTLGHLRFSPPRSRTPHKYAPGDRPRTPPTSPPKPTLRSPTKSFHRIPPSPHRPSIDAFWSQEVINDWNDQHSPQKLTSPRKLFSVREDDGTDLPPSTSPRKTPLKSPLKSPSKRDTAAIARRKAFDDQKHQLATSFLQELDTNVADGRVAAMTESAGGIQIIWSKKLHSTAGRAIWKRETVRSKPADGNTSSATTTTYLHHASIELAEKVIDDADRLRNVLAHEYCHLANFMISDVKNNPHGKEFKAWAARATALFAGQGIKVTTTHSYAIQYKYSWACANTEGGCGMEYKRHSKSIDPRRHRCGDCRGRLVQVQPAPRKGKGGGEEESGGKVVLSEYQRFVKGNFARLKVENPGVGVGEVMRRLGEEFRMLKAEGRVGEGGEERRKVVADNDDERGEKEEGGMNDVVRKLDFLNLG